MSVRLSILLAALMASVAMAPMVLADSKDCPSGPAVDGVYLAFDTRVVRHERLADGGTAEMEFFTDDGSLFEYRTHPLGLILASWEIVRGEIVVETQEMVSFPDTSQDLPHPAPGLTWSGTEQVRYTDGTGYRYQTTVTVEDQDVFPIGACQYVALPIRVERRDLDTNDLLIDESVYLTELGIVVHVGYNEVGSTVTYDLPREIGRRPPAPAAGGAQVDSK